MSTGKQFLTVSEAEKTHARQLNIAEYDGQISFAQSEAEKLEFVRNQLFNKK